MGESQEEEEEEEEEEEVLPSLFNPRGTQVYVAGSRQVRVDSKKEVRGTGTGLSKDRELVGFYEWQAGGVYGGGAGGRHEDVRGARGTGFVFF